MNDNRTILTDTAVSRRVFMGTALSSGALVLSGCQGLGGISLVDAMRRLLVLSSERAFARMLQPDGFWDDAVSGLGINALLGVRGNVVADILTSTLFKSRLEDAFGDIALAGAERAAPIVVDAVRVIGISNAIDLVRGGPTAATSFLRAEIGTGLIEAMVPELGDAMRIAQEPLVGRLLAGLAGVDVAGASRSFSRTIDDTIWREIGIEETAIRSDPAATRDPLLIGVFAGAGVL